MSIKISALIMAMTLCMSTSAIAAYTGPGSMVAITTVAQVAKAHDDTPVELTGFIVKNLGSEDYLFRDHSGEVKVEIENEVLQHVSINETTEVTLYGEVDDEWGGNEVEVDRLVVKN